MTEGWEALVDWGGGAVVGLTVTPAGSARRLVLAATPVGIFRSVDGGGSWSLAGHSNNVPFAEVVATSPDFNRDHTMFAGAPDGLYRSVDGGESWQHLLRDCAVPSLAVARDESGGLVLFAATESDGVLRSDNLGRSWEGANPGLFELTVLALAVSPAFERDQVGFLGTDAGLYRTRNGGRSWRTVELPFEAATIQCLAVSPAFPDDRLVLAGTESDGLLRSEDGGSSWQATLGLAARAVNGLAFSPCYPARRTCAAATDLGVAISDDGGLSWRLCGAELGSVQCVAFVAQDEGEALLAGLPERGVARSDDGGRTWRAASRGLSARLLVGLIPSPAFEQDRTLFVFGPRDGLLRSTDGGYRWAECSAELGGAEVVALAISPDYLDDQTLFAASSAGLLRSRDRGSTWQPAVGGGWLGPSRAVTTGPRVGEARWPVLAVLDDGELLASDDRGDSWRSLGRPFEGAAIVSSAYSPAYARDRTIFVGTSQLLAAGPGELVLWRSVDGGGSWGRWLVDSGAEVLPLAVPPDDAQADLLFAGVGGRVVKPVRQVQEVRAGQRRPVWRGNELGNGSPGVTTLALSPRFRSDRTLFAGTSAGVFVSRDGGERFERWGGAAGPGAVVALAAAPSEQNECLVFALGLGGTIWRRRAGRQAQ